VSHARESVKVAAGQAEPETAVGGPHAKPSERPGAANSSESMAYGGFGAERIRFHLAAGSNKSQIRVSSRLCHSSDRMDR